jgi:hypothetical protein
MIFMLGDAYRLPFSTVEVGTFERNHRHSTPWGSTWDEVMRFSVQVIGVNRPIRLFVANDNQKAASHG